MATLIESAATSTTLTGLVMVPVGSSNVTSRSIQSSRKIVGKLTGHTLDQLAVIDVYEKFEVHAAFIVAKVRVFGGVGRGVGWRTCRRLF